MDGRGRILGIDNGRSKVEERTDDRLEGCCEALLIVPEGGISQGAEDVDPRAGFSRRRHSVGVEAEHRVVSDSEKLWMFLLRDDTTANVDRGQATNLFRPRREQRHRRLGGREGEAEIQGLVRELIGRGGERSGDIDGRDSRLGGMEVIRVAFVD